MAKALNKDLNEANVRYVSVIGEIGLHFLMHDRSKGGSNVYGILCMGPFLHTTTFFVLGSTVIANSGEQFHDFQVSR